MLLSWGADAEGGGDGEGVAEWVREWRATPKKLQFKTRIHTHNQIAHLNTPVDTGPSSRVDLFDELVHARHTHQ